MKTAAVICEFNPFHNGHAYLLRKLREEYEADYIIAIMSGNYVQRGEPAVFSKYTRAEAALKGDKDKGHADVVIELPTLYSTASARNFARYGVRLAVWCGVVDMLGFGVEDGVCLEDIKKQALLKDTLMTNKAANALIRELLSSGLSYPEAEAACFEQLGKQSISSAPNNILATEYLRALNMFDRKHDIEPVAVSRIGDGFNTVNAIDANYCSATALRKILFDNKYGDLICGHYIPESTYLDSSKPISPNILSGLLSKILLDAKYRGLKLTDYSDVSREIADRLLKTADNPLSFTERIEAVKTKQYTYTRISRALLHIVLDIRKADAGSLVIHSSLASVSARTADSTIMTSDTDSQVHHFETCGSSFSLTAPGPYIRLLGFRKSASELLKKLKACSAVPVITKVADHASLMSDEIYYSELLYALTGEKSEYEHSPIVL